MFLALKEMARAKTRFGLLVAAIALLVFLILFQQSIQNGLITGFVGAIRNQNAPVLVYSVDGQRVIQGSIIPPDLEAELRVDRRGRRGRPARSGHVHRTAHAVPTTPSTPRSSGTNSVRTARGSARRATWSGAAIRPATSKRSPARGGDFEFEVGDTVVLQPGGFAVEVVGLADDIQLNVAPTLFASYDTWTDAVQSVNPDAGEPLPNVMLAAPADGVTDDELVETINDQSLDLDALTRADAAAEDARCLPGRNSRSS